MKSITNSREKENQYALPKLVKRILVLSIFARALTSYAQPDSCSAHAYFTVSTTDYKNLVITNYSKGNNLVYLWNFGDGTSSTAENPGTHVYASNEIHVISLKVTDVIKNCSAVFADTIIHADTTGKSCSATFSFTFNQHDYSFRANPSMDPNTTNYAWSFGDGSTSTLANPTHHYLNKGSYQACLTVTSTHDTTCLDTRCLYIVMDTLADTSAVCSAQFASWKIQDFTYVFEAAQNDCNYFWDFGDGTISTQKKVQHVFLNAQSYNVCLTVTSKNMPFCSNKQCNIVEVYPSKYCKALYFIEPDTSTTDPYDFLIYNASTGKNLRYFWDFGDGSTSTLPNPTHDYTGTGPYRLCLTINNDSCTSTYCDTLTLSDTSHHLLPGKFHITVIGNKITGIKKDDLNKTTLSNYPNPFSGTTTISYSIIASSIVELEVYNLLGVKVAAMEGGAKAPGNYKLDWNAQHLQEGIYMLQLKAGNQSIIKKMVISK